MALGRERFDSVLEKLRNNKITSLTNNELGIGFMDEGELWELLQALKQNITLISSVIKWKK